MAVTSVALGNFSMHAVNQESRVRGRFLPNAVDLRIPARLSGGHKARPYVDGQPFAVGAGLCPPHLPA